MKKHRFIAGAVLTAALAAAVAVPAWASSVEVEILQIDEPLDTGSSAPGRSEQARNVTPQTTAAATEAPGGQTADAPAPAAASQSTAPQSTGSKDDTSQQTVTLTAQQRSVILELVPDDLYRFYTSRLWDSVPETSVDIEAVYGQDLVNELYGVLRNATRDSAIFTPVEHAAVEGYSIWFDKDDALRKIAGLYGRNITEAAIAEYNTEWGGDMPDMIAVSGNAIASLDPDGEGKVSPSIESCIENGDELRVSLTFTATFSDSKDNGSGHATAVFTADPDSIIGYRLKTIALN